jgi:hypothetical protein
MRRRLWPHDKVLPPGSDARIRGGIRRRCVACGTRAQLRLGHVIPRWAFKWHRAAWEGKIRGFYPSIGVISEDQDSNKHYLLCINCELLASKAEQYVKTLVSETRSAQWSREIIRLSFGWFLHLDAQKIARFVAIVALRCHYAPSPPFHHLSIPRHFRKQLRQKFFGRLAMHEHPWIGTVEFVPPKSDREHDPRCDIHTHFEFNEILGPVFTALVGGWEWYIWFQPKRSWLGKIALRRDWFVRIGVLPFNEHRTISRMAEAIAPYRDKLKSALS